MRKKSKRKICVVTGSRAEYGIIYWLLKEIMGDPDLCLQLAVTGMHMEKKFGSTYRQIEKDGFRIDAKILMGLSDDTEEGVTRSMGLGFTGFGRAFARLRPDIVVVSGDKFEILAAAGAALVSRIPIAHIHGGEITEGAYDDAVRHAVTKMAYYHFVSHAEYAGRVIQMGEDPARVFNYGAPGIDNMKRLKLKGKNELEDELGMKFTGNEALLTFHPVTLEKGQAGSQIRTLIRAVHDAGLRVIFTMPNADQENDVIFREIRKYVKAHPACSRWFTSLGQTSYLSLMKYIRLMIGNSSSGIVESPSFRLPVVNVGIRQKGRIKAPNVIDAACGYSEIRKAIKKALSPGFSESLKGLRNPFGDGRASGRIKDRLKRMDLNTCVKKFRDLR
ncbi:MAG: UDP-N-acetylglucosamine 2-epimerase [Candidatus Omnitrophota bacterium]